VKVNQGSFAQNLERAVRTCRVFYFCGPDEAGAHDAAQAVIVRLPEGSERVDLAGSELKRDPVKLSDEARSTSLFGGTRYIFVRTVGDEACEAIEVLLDSPEEPCPVLIVATSATDKSRVAKLLLERSDALVAMFHAPELSSVTGSVRSMADAAGVRIDAAMAERIARGCALDTRMARSEIDKLALYLDATPQAPKSADAAALDAITASNDDESFGGIVTTVLGGDAARVPGELARMRELGMSPVGLLLAFERRVAQLGQLAALLGRRSDIGAFVQSKKGSPLVFFRDTAEITNQLRRWRGKRLERLIDRLIALHRDLLANSQHADLLLAQGLTEIARAAQVEGDRRERPGRAHAAPR
jgi:DNA polymerase-3 subunit delta